MSIDINVLSIDNKQKKSDLLNKVGELFDKYKSNEYVLDKLENYINNIIPYSLESYNKNNSLREKRKIKLQSEKNIFTEKFLLQNKFSYCQYNELFLEYNGLHFNAISEDDIQHKILSTITSEQQLINWKYKIRNNIIKQIREISPLITVPESITIQFVLNNLYPNILPSRNYAKYFLTIIGDCILNKNMSSKIIYLASSNLKDLVREINNQTYLYFGISNVLNCIKFKYYDHDYSSCRLLHIANNLNVEGNNWYVSKYILDFLCVATHYSVRYESADKFLEQCTESSLIEHAMYLTKHTSNDIVKLFINNSIQKCNGSNITNNNLIFLWKKYLESLNIPNILFYDALKNILHNELEYDKNKDIYLNVTSKNLPMVASFIQFWEKTIKDDYENEFEIDELNKLFKYFHGKNWSVSDTLFIEFIKHFYPDIYINDDKFINVRCNMWDKRNEVILSLDKFKNYCINNNNNLLESIESAYDFYFKTKKYKWIASKGYFEKVTKEVLKKYIDKDNIFISEWKSYDILENNI